jgi:hypothetical protein
MEKQIIEKLTNVIKSEIKELSKAYKAYNGNSSLRIPNKDMNLWIVKEILDLRTDIAVMKTKTRLMMWFFTATIAILAIAALI